MKPFLCLVLVLALSGCSSMPKDSLVRGLKIGATPWTPTVDAEVIATGKAASNLTAEERAAILAPKK
jgi:lipoprotein NlpI